MRFIGIATCITQFNFWTYLLLTSTWLIKVSKNSKTSRSQLEVSTKITIFCFLMVLLLEMIYVTFEWYDRMSGDQKFIVVVNKLAEYSSCIVLFHFVFELQPVLIIVNEKLTIRE